MKLVPLDEIAIVGTEPLRFARNFKVFVYRRGTTTQVQLYADEAGLTTLAQPLVVDASGHPEGLAGEQGWLAPGSYDLLIGSTRTQFEAAFGQPTPFFAGSAEVIEPRIAELPEGTEYRWDKTDGAGTLLDVITGVA